MQVPKRTPEEITKRCEILKSMGFVLWEGDRRVYWSTPTNATCLWFDFSEVEEADFAVYAVQRMSAAAHNEGRKSLKYDLSQLLTPEE